MGKSNEFASSVLISPLTPLFGISDQGLEGLKKGHLIARKTEFEAGLRRLWKNVANIIEQTQAMEIKKGLNGIEEKKGKRKKE
jgi:hypothetical protein